MPDTHNETTFIEHAHHYGWSESLLTSLIELLDGYDHLLSGTRKIDDWIVSSVKDGSEEFKRHNPHGTNLFLMVLNIPAVQRMDTEQACEFYKAHNKQMAKSLRLSALSHNYDKDGLITYIAPGIPHEFLPVFWQGGGSELLTNNFSSEPEYGKLSCELLCHYVVLYTIFMLMYELIIHVEQSERHELDDSF